MGIYIDPSAEERGFLSTNIRRMYVYVNLEYCGKTVAICENRFFVTTHNNAAFLGWMPITVDMVN